MLIHTIPCIHYTVAAFVRFLDLILKGIGGESIQVCAKLEESIGSIERQMKLLVTDINGTAYRRFTSIKNILFILHFECKK